jgi:hypothetical protein
MEHVADAKAEYLAALDGFYQEIDSWLKNTSLTTAGGQVLLREKISEIIPLR